jgi:hypothetical protein
MLRARRFLARLPMLAVLASSALLMRCGGDGATNASSGSDAGGTTLDAAHEASDGTTDAGAHPDGPVDANHPADASPSDAAVDAGWVDAPSDAPATLDGHAPIDAAVVDAAIDASPAADAAGTDGGGTGACGNGTLGWARAVGTQFGLGATLEGWAVATHADGSFVITGTITNGTVTFGAGTAKQQVLTGSLRGDAFLARFAADGTYLWGRVYGSSNGAAGIALRTLADGSTILAGQFEGQLTLDYGLPTQQTLSATGGADDFDVFLAHVAPDGTLLWVKRAGGTDFDFPFGLEVRPDGSSVVTGRFGTAFEDSITFNPGQPGAITLTRPSGNFEENFIALFDSAGTAQWARASGGSSRDDETYGVSILADGSIAVSGVFVKDTSFEGQAAPVTLASTADRSLFVARYESDGTLDWARAPTGSSIGYPVRPDPSGAILLTGAAEGTAVFGAGEPTQASLGGTGGDFVARYASDGSFVGFRRWGMVTDEWDMRTIGSGDAIVAGDFYMQGTFATSSGDQTLTALGWEDAYLACVHTASGTVAWVRQLGGTQHDYARSVTRMPNGDLLVLGYFTADMTVDVGLPSATPLGLGGGSGNVFLARYTP